MVELGLFLVVLSKGIQCIFGVHNDTLGNLINYDKRRENALYHQRPLGKMIVFTITECC